MIGWFFTKVKNWLIFSFLTLSTYVRLFRKNNITNTKSLYIRFEIKELLNTKELQVPKIGALSEEMGAVEESSNAGSSWVEPFSTRTSSFLLLSINYISLRALQFTKLRKRIWHKWLFQHNILLSIQTLYSWGVKVYNLHKKINYKIRWLIVLHKI